MRHPQRLTVPIHLDRNLPEPLHDQLAAQLRQAIIRGQLAASTRMPSTRTLAAVLGVSRGVALSAFETLLSEGYITGRHGSGTYVTKTLPPHATHHELPAYRPTAPALPSAPRATTGRPPGHYTQLFGHPTTTPLHNRTTTGAPRGYRPSAPGVHPGPRVTTSGTPGRRVGAPNGVAGQRGATPNGAAGQRGVTPNGAAGQRGGVPSSAPGQAPQNPAYAGGTGGMRPVIDLRVERPTAQAFPLAAWRSAWRRASHRPPLDEPPAAGLPELRAAITDYLRDTRGLVLDGHEVVVAAGLGDALELILGSQGAPPPMIALEDPAPPAIRRALGRLGTVVPLPSDGSGARPDLIPAACDVVAVLPDRGNPLGARMPTERRQAFAAWSRERGGLVLEPALGGLFNTALSPRPSVLSLGEAGSTAMVGSFCDVLTPTLRLSFAVVPHHLARAIEEGGHGQPSFTCQVAVTDLLTSGCVIRRAEHLSHLYAAKRTLVRQTLGAYPDVRLLGAETGAAATLLLPPTVRAESVARGLRTRRVQVAELATYHHPRATPGNGVVFHFGHLDGITLRRALHAMTRTLDDHRLSRHTAA